MAVALQRPRLTVDEFQRTAGSDVFGDVLLVEVADTSVGFDRGVEARRYAAAGISEYWVVDIPGRCIWTMTDPGPDGYGDMRRHRDGMLMPMGVPVDVTTLL